MRYILISILVTATLTASAKDVDLMSDLTSATAACAYLRTRTPVDATDLQLRARARNSGYLKAAQQAVMKGGLTTATMELQRSQSAYRKLWEAR
jgi:hypothetical protein